MFFQQLDGVPVEVFTRPLPRWNVNSIQSAGASVFKADCGKICIAVDEDIDPENSDALLWAIAFRMDPSVDLQVLRYRSPGHGPGRR